MIFALWTSSKVSQVQAKLDNDFIYILDINFPPHKLEINRPKASRRKKKILSMESKEEEEEEKCVGNRMPVIIDRYGSSIVHR